jgi:hypothetical protein
MTACSEINLWYYPGISPDRLSAIRKTTMRIADLWANIPTQNLLNMGPVFGLLLQMQMKHTTVSHHTP